MGLRVRVRLAGKEAHGYVETIRFKLNRKPTVMTVDGERKLLWVLRSDLGLTGAKYGCGEGICGACTVLVNNKATRSFRSL